MQAQANEGVRARRAYSKMAYLIDDVNEISARALAHNDIARTHAHRLQQRKNLPPTCCQRRCCGACPLRHAETMRLRLQVRE